MADTSNWPLNRATAVYLVAMDVVGFSKKMDDPAALYTVRATFMQAVQATDFFPLMLEKHAVRAHFLGDELRLAFLASETTPRNVRRFAIDVLLDLARRGRNAPELRTVVLHGPVMARERLRCRYLEGLVTCKAQRWLGAKVLNPGDIGTDAPLESMEWEARQFGPDRGWVHATAPRGPSK